MNNLLKDLGDGLHLKQATPEDAERLASYNLRTLSEDPEDLFEPLEHWTRDLMFNHHTAGADDFTYVEDSRRGKIVSSLCLISQVWTYEEIPFGVGRVEMVSTHRDYRRRGLVRAQFEVLHQWSREKGELMTAITGIPYFYRQFGYEMTLPLGGRRRGFHPQVPKLKDDEQEPFTFRLATGDDIPLINKLYDRGRERSMISCPRHKAVWQYEMSIQHESFRSDISIIEDLDGEPVGFIWHDNKLHNGNIGTICYELKPGISWAAVTPSVIRHLGSRGEALAAEAADKTWDTFSFNLGENHPAYEVAAQYLSNMNTNRYTWYIRIPDLAAFLKRISPVLNRRLAASDFSAYDSELLLDFHRSGVKLSFDKGVLVDAEAWQPSTDDRGDLGFPGLSFLHLVCGYRSFSELRDFFSDCYSGKKSEAPALIEALFPTRPSHVLGIL